MYGIISLIGMGRCGQNMTFLSGFNIKGPSLTNMWERGVLKIRRVIRSLPRDECGNHG